MSERPPDVEGVAQRLAELQARKRNKIRWGISKHTAELAIGALEASVPRAQRGTGGKPRYRRRHKRFL